MRDLLVVAAALQVAAVLYCALLLHGHRNAATAWLCLLGALLSMLVWRIVMTTGATPGLMFNTVIAIRGSVCAVLAMFFFGREIARRERAEGERDRLLASERAARSEAEQASRRGQTTREWLTRKPERFRLSSVNSTVALLVRGVLSIRHLWQPHE